MNEKKFRTTITTTQAAAHLGITPRHVRHLIKIGQLPAVKAGRDWLIEEKNLKQAEARRKPGRPRKGAGMLAKGQKYNENRLSFVGWHNPKKEDLSGYSAWAYFDNGVYAGPDQYGVEPIFRPRQKGDA